MLAVSCSQADIIERACENEIEKAPTGYSEVLLDVAKFDDIPDRDLFFESKICPQTSIAGILSVETQDAINDWLDRSGTPYNSHMTIGSARFTIYKFGDGEREFFVTTFYPSSES